jgi:hypothetical protein
MNKLSIINFLFKWILKWIQMHENDEFQVYKIIFLGFSVQIYCKKFDKFLVAFYLGFCIRNTLQCMFFPSTASLYMVDRRVKQNGSTFTLSPLRNHGCSATGWVRKTLHNFYENLVWQTHPVAMVAYHWRGDIFA